MYVIVSNHIIREVSILKQEGDMCVIRFLDTGGGTRIHRSRLYATEAAAEKAMPKRKRMIMVGNSMGPWAYEH